MPVVQDAPKELAFVYIYDPVPIPKFTLDPLRTQTAFTQITAAENVLVLEAPEKRIRTTIQSARLEYLDGNESGFKDREVKYLDDLWQRLPPLSVKAMGVNVHMRRTFQGVTRGGEFVRNRFLASHDELQGKLGKQILAGATRLVYGDTSQHFDLRITPVDLTGEWVHVQLHLHREIQITDSERLLVETKDSLGYTLEELIRLDGFLWD